MHEPKTQALSLLQGAQKILCVTQSIPRGDGVASVLAFKALCDSLGKSCTPFMGSRVTKNLNFLPGVSDLVYDLAAKQEFVISLSTHQAEVDHIKYVTEGDTVDILITPKDGHKFDPKDVLVHQGLEKFDLIVTLDVPHLESLGPLFEEHPMIFSNTPILNISADSVNDQYGKVNLVEAGASSTSEILARLMLEQSDLKVFLDPALATTLLAGIVSATESFLSPLTTASAFEVAADLQALEADQPQIIEQLFKQKSLKTLKLWGRVLGNLQLDPIHKITWSQVSSGDFASTEATLDDIDAITGEILAYTRGSEIALLFLAGATDGHVEVRTGTSGISYQELQRIIGGTVTPTGLDCMVKGKTLAEVEYEILQKVLAFQKKRLHIDPELPIQKFVPEQHLEVTDFAAMTDSVERAFPHAPQVIPFEAPMVEKKEKPSTTPPPSKTIPQWLKKSFPDN